MDYQTLKGTHDLIGVDAELYEASEAEFKAIAKKFSYAPIYTPTIEMSELFLRSVGGGSDIVRKEMYSFLDKGGRNISLRPEHTASIVRAFVNAKLYATAHLPYKVYYLGPAFRYERPQKGRLREFVQFGVESIGVSNVEEDVDVIILAYEIFLSFRIPAKLKINYLGSDESRANYMKALKAFVAPKLDSMCADCKERYEKNPLRMLDCKVKEDQDILKDAPKLKDYLSDEDKTKFKRILTMLDNLSIDYEVDENLVRGLDYYSGVVFEIYAEDNLSLGAILAGGHYDHLVEQLGGPSLSSVGFSLGVDRFVMYLKSQTNLDEFSTSPMAYIIPIGEDASVRSYALFVRYYLSTVAYIDTDIALNTKSVSSAMKYASKNKIKYAILIGEEEEKERIIQVKDLETQTQRAMNLEQFCELLDENEHHCCHHQNEDDEHHCCHKEDEENEHHCCCSNHHKEK